MALLAENISQGWVADERQQREYIHTIMREVSQMNEQINQLLDFSRIESGRKPYQLKAGDLAATVNQVLEEFSGRIRQAGFILETEIAGGLPALSFDAEAIRLILVNLLQNALKYSEKEKYIRVRLFRDGAQAVIEVADQGIGMAAKELRRIFERFHRVEDARVRAREGSGLGLFLVQHAVTAHQGRVTVSSRPDAGSIFTVYLPLKNNKQKQVHS
jgi:signal transduction histidine kinase